MNLTELRNSMHARWVNQKREGTIDRIPELKNEIEKIQKQASVIWDQVHTYSLEVHEEMNCTDDIFSAELVEEYDKLLKKCQELSSGLKALKECEGDFTRDLSILSERVSQLISALEDKNSAVKAEARTSKHIVRI